MTLHKFFHWHDADWRILFRNDDGSVAEIACANCDCPKNSLGYTCRDRVYYRNGRPEKECGSWKSFEVYDFGYDGAVVGHRTVFKP